MGAEEAWGEMVDRLNVFLNAQGLIWNPDQIKDQLSRLKQAHKEMTQMLTIMKQTTKDLTNDYSTLKRRLPAASTSKTEQGVEEPLNDILKKRGQKEQEYYQDMEKLEDWWSPYNDLIDSMNTLSDELNLMNQQRIGMLSDLRATKTELNRLEKDIKEKKEKKKKKNIEKKKKKKKKK